MIDWDARMMGLAKHVAQWSKDHGHCPACNASMNGELIWQTMLEQSNGDEAEADRKAEMYGATRTSGRWGRRIGLYDMGRDATMAYQCPDCQFVWTRES